MKLKIKLEEARELLTGEDYEYPKYTTQLMNLANQNSQATRPRNVGQLSDLIQEFKGNKLEEWEEWYLKKYPDTIDEATNKVFKMVKNLEESIAQIDEEMVRKWVKELIIVKTFSGLKFQETILIKLSEKYELPYRLAKPEDENKGIDGYIGDKPISIKPSTYKTKDALNESIEVLIVFYEKKKNRIEIEFDETYFE